MLDEGIKFGADGGGEGKMAGRKLPPLKDGVIGSTCNATVAMVSLAVVLVHLCSSTTHYFMLSSIGGQSTHIRHNVFVSHRLKTMELSLREWCIGWCYLYTRI